MPPVNVWLYFSPFGGKCLAVLDDESAEYERSLDRQGVEWRKEKVKSADVPKDKNGYQADRLFYRENPEKPGEKKMEVAG